MILVTGGAGFIGAHLANRLVEDGYRVRALDNLDPQAHETGEPPVHLHADVEFVAADLRDRDAVALALDRVEVVFHQGGMVGNGQSMYELHRYVDVNGCGTAVLLEEILRRRDRVSRLVVASSMVVYGEGAYHCDEHGTVTPGKRSAERLAARDWEPRCPRCAGPVTPLATDEATPLQCASTYAISKRTCEELCLVAGAAHGLPVVALRYMNVYGPHQALSNPYTGVAAIFAARLLAGRRPLLFENGQQRRDLIHVSDVVRANLLALTAADAVGHAINIGTGVAITVTELARTLAANLGVALEPEVTGRFRAGDVRHCWADVDLAKVVLGFVADVDRTSGLLELAEWAAQQLPVGRFDEAVEALVARRLIT